MLTLHEGAPLTHHKPYLVKTLSITAYTHKSITISGFTPVVQSFLYGSTDTWADSIN